MKSTTFEALGLVKTIDAITEKGFREPTAVQAMTIPVLLSEAVDIVAQARTGTGKTAAFGLPLVEMLEPRQGHVQAIILTPTRELALQVCTEIADFSKNGKLTLLPVYGGQAMGDQLRKLRSGVDVVVGTPGRVMDHLRRGSLDLSKVSYVVLDEADEMLDMGFVEDIETILKSANSDRRMLLFSATMSPRIMKIAENYMGKYTVLKAPAGESSAKLTEQIVIEVEERDRFEALCRVVDMDSEFYGIVFCRTRADVDHVAQKLSKHGYGAEALHGDVTQVQREKILNKMRTREISILVATDVAARGIDINGLTHVINYALPQDPEAYIHRIGRTGRAGKNGTAVTFVARGEFRKLHFIKKISGSQILEKELPTVETIIEAKKARILEKISGAISEGSAEECKEMARALMNGCDPVDAIAALLSVSYGKELDRSSYADIRKAPPRAERSGRDYSSGPRRDDRGKRRFGSDRDRGDRSARPFRSEKKSDGKPFTGKKTFKTGPKKESRAS